MAGTGLLCQRATWLDPKLDTVDDNTANNANMVMDDGPDAHREGIWMPEG